MRCRLARLRLVCDICRICYGDTCAGQGIWGIEFAGALLAVNREEAECSSGCPSIGGHGDDRFVVLRRRLFQVAF